MYLVNTQSQHSLFICLIFFNSEDYFSYSVAVTVQRTYYIRGLIIKKNKGEGGGGTRGREIFSYCVIKKMNLLINTYYGEMHRKTKVQGFTERKKGIIEIFESRVPILN